MFGVTSATATRWAKQGRLTDIRTPGGQHRFRASEVQELFSKSAAYRDDGTAGAPG